MSSAAGNPISRGSLVVPPHAGKIPSVTSGSPICALGLSDITRQSQESEISQPPPNAAPLIAATVVCGSFEKRWNTCWPKRVYSFACSGLVAFENSLTSAPAMKIDGLPEARTMCLMSLDFSISLTMSANSIITVEENLFTFSPGRSNQMTARSPSRWMRNAPAARGGASSVAVMSRRPHPCTARR